jgi:hypothetical protein
MAGKINVTVALGGMVTMVKETPATLNLQPALSTCVGYISSAGITFAYVAGACTLTIASGFTAAGFTGMDGEQILISGSGKNDGLYTLASDTDTVLTLSAADVLVAEAAGATVVIYGVQVYKITPTKKNENLLIVYSEGLEAAGEVGMIPCILNGAFWAANAGLYTAFAATAVTGTPHGTYYLWVETSKFLQADGTILVMLKPKATKQLYTDHQPALGFLQLP